ncbi:MAG: FecR domain-containing protein [Chloracidobacterium sp.]|uniref:FecR domain-containing protein n=1 Tax=Chloracidobacterium validum TaxID=2821543 RepID=A0ABX8BAT0_9BACT|nr:FecR domain-containing protein [Chloracidobacterium validum]QUW03126.1 FecR domain-containing protein [Chloracidobacterium validum]
MYVQPGNKNAASTKFKRPLLDWYLISRRTFYQVIAGFLLLVAAIVGLYLWKRHQDALAGQFEAQSARLVQVLGSVSIKRARTNQLEQATPNALLEPGDIIITASDGSAVIQYVDRSVLKLKPDSSVLIQENAKNTKTDQQVVRNRVEGGTVNISTGVIRTSDDVNELASKNIKFNVTQNTSAEVNVAGERVRVNVERGEIRSTTDRGVTESIRTNTSVEYERDQKTAQYTLLAPPRLSSPTNARVFPLEYGKPLPVMFSWGTVSEAARYQLQVADSQYFLDRALIFEKDTDSSEFAWQVNSQSGTYWWRVRAVARDGRPGVWSEEFRLTFVPRQPGLTDTPIYIGNVRVSRVAAGIHNVSGETEPGAEIRINGRAVPVDSDGRFSLVLPGQTFRIAASDARGRHGEKIVTN